MIRQFLSVAAGVAAGLWLWNWWARRGRAPAPAGGAGGLLPTSPATVSVTGGGGSDFTQLAAAIQALAAGVQLPAIVTAVLPSGSSGLQTLAAGQNGRRYCVLAFSVIGAGTVTAEFRSGGTQALWRAEYAAPAGNSGSNLATAWPGFLFATMPNDALSVWLSAPAAVSVTYWLETA